MLCVPIIFGLNLHIVGTKIHIIYICVCVCNEHWTKIVLFDVKLIPLNTRVFSYYKIHKPILVSNYIREHNMFFGNTY